VGAVIDSHQTGGGQGASVPRTNDGELGSGVINDPPFYHGQDAV
jgi:hypothetical protein